MRLKMLCASLWFLAFPALADDKPDCENGSQMELTMCAYNDFEKADKELNKYWPIAKKDAEQVDANYDDKDKGDLKALMESQRAWLAYRDTHCTYRAYQAHGGSMEPMLFSGCKAELTKIRIKELRDIVDGKN